jgi:hypothetical protein
VLFEIQSLSEVKEGACYMQNFLVWDRLDVVQFILCVFHFSRNVTQAHTMILNPYNATYPLYKPSLNHQEYCSMLIDICSLEIDTYSKGW